MLCDTEILLFTHIFLPSVDFHSFPSTLCQLLISETLIDIAKVIAEAVADVTADIFYSGRELIQVVPLLFLKEEEVE